MIKQRIDLNKKERILQGDIFKDIPFYETFNVNDGIINVNLIEYPYVVVLTQDCDLLQEKNELLKNNDIKQFDKKLISTLVAPLYNAELFWKGEHVIDLGYKAREIRPDKTEGDIIKKNNNPRYHYLSFPETVPLVDMIVDFKHYFTVTTEYLNTNLKDKVCTLSDLYRENISHRYSFYLSRIGLPD